MGASPWEFKSLQPHHLKMTTERVVFFIGLLLSNISPVKDMAYYMRTAIRLDHEDKWRNIAGKTVAGYKNKEELWERLPSFKDREAVIPLGATVV